MEAEALRSPLSSPAGSTTRKATKRYRGSRPKVAVDVDEVLAQFLLSLNSYYEDRFSKRYGIEHYDEYYFCKIWDCSPDDSNDIVHQFFDSHHFRDGIVPVPGALQALRELRTKCDLVVITSRQNAIRSATERWVESHFPGVFEDLFFCNHFALDGESVSKAEMCSRVGADLLIDDNPGYASDCAGSGLDVILFDYKSSYPWSKACEEHENIRRCADWEEILDKIEELYFRPTLPPIGA
ncbi:haloacid dehalogenase-like hydrolase [Chloropicon primus]|nr:haloacid dehalogenase-like hydrolase [Chloropicon primus]UPR02251.1 haloacid dehalogenase-like hydrolase [Chloropicon primus]|eukprot:QDZ23033.1 haloacid dehalogenase-like hydrolase [Chloropicon primus]